MFGEFVATLFIYFMKVFIVLSIFTSYKQIQIDDQVLKRLKFCGITLIKDVF